MRRILLWVALLASGLTSLIIIALCAPLLAAMRDNRRERELSEQRADALQLADDPGVEVDL